MALEKPTKILLSGIALAMVVIIAGHGILILYRKADLSALVQKCESEAATDKSKATGNWKKFSFICDPKLLDRTETGHRLPSGVQGEIIRAKGHIYSPSDTVMLLGIGLALVFSLPFFWYFLLRRIKELRDVLVGK